MVGPPQRGVHERRQWIERRERARRGAAADALEAARRAQAGDAELRVLRGERPRADTGQQRRNENEVPGHAAHGEKVIRGM